MNVKYLMGIYLMRSNVFLEKLFVFNHYDIDVNQLMIEFPK